MARLRIFIAVGVPASVTKRLTALQSDLAEAGTDVRWVPLENFHLTLLFLGEVDQLDTVKICRLVRQRARLHEPFRVEVAGVGAFPNLRRPKIIWAGVGEGAAELQELHADLEEGLFDLGCYRREERDYSPHFTLGRISGEESAEAWGKVLEEHQGWIGGGFPVEEVLIMASEMRRSGPEYSVVGRAPLLDSPDRSE